MNISPNLIVKVLFVLLYVYIVFRLFKYFKIYTLYMLNEKVVWDKEIDKPRLYVHSLFLPASLIFCIQTIKEEELSTIVIGVKVFYFFASVVMIWFCHFTWSKKFETVFIPKIKEKIKSKRNYGVKLSKKKLKCIYKELERYEFIDNTKTLEEDFIKVFLLDWDSHSSIVHLEMDNLQLKLFLDQLRTVLEIKLPLARLEEAENIYNKNNKIKPGSISASVWRNNKNGGMPPKRAELIKSIVQDLKKG